MQRARTIPASASSGIQVNLCRFELLIEIGVLVMIY
jgi:hypothetical protein